MALLAHLTKHDSPLDALVEQLVREIEGDSLEGKPAASWSWYYVAEGNNQTDGSGSPLRLRSKTHSSRCTALATLSERRPKNAACRSQPSAVHSANRI